MALLGKSVKLGYNTVPLVKKITLSAACLLLATYTAGTPFSPNLYFIRLLLIDNQIDTLKLYLNYPQQLALCE